jgi:hypothetical protein
MSMTDLEAVQRDIETLTGKPLPDAGTREHLLTMQAVQNTRPDLADAYFALTRATTVSSAPPASLTRQLNLSRWRDRLEAWKSALLQRSSVAGKKVPDKRKFWIIAGGVGALALVGFFAMSATPSKKAEGPNLLGGIAGKDVRGKPGSTLPEDNPATTATSRASRDAAPAPETVNAALALPTPLRTDASPGSPSSAASASSPSQTGTDAAPRYGVTSAPPYATSATDVPANPSAPYRSTPVTNNSSSTAANTASNAPRSAAPRSTTPRSGQKMHVVAPRAGVLGAAAIPPTGQSPLAQSATLPGSPFNAPPSGAPGAPPATTPSSVVSRPTATSQPRTVSVPASSSSSTVRTAPTSPRSNTLVSSVAVPVPSASSVVRAVSPSTTTFVRAGNGGGSVNVQGASPSSGSVFTRVGSPPPPITTAAVATPAAESSSPVGPSIPVPPPVTSAAPAPPPVTTALTAPGLELLIPGVRLGDRLEARMMTTVIAVESGTSPLIAQTARDGCDAPPCAPILWIGEAFLGADKRVHGRITRAVVGEREVAIKGQLLGADLGPGIVADIRDEAPTLVMDLLRGSISAFGDYLGAAVSQKTTTVISGGAVQSTNLPSLTDFFLGKIGQLFSLGANPSPTFVRVARVEKGTTFTVLYGIEPAAATPSR